VAEAVVNPTWLYVGALYAVAVALARRARVGLPWRVAALFYALVLAFLFRPMTGPYNNVAPDVLGLLPPWEVAGFDKYAVSNYELQDVMFELAPWAHQVRTSWRALHVPLWNALAGCGMPLLANMQSAALSPIRLLALPLPLAYALTAEAAMKILVALTFTFLYCRRRYDVMPSVAGAISFGFGTFILSWLHYPIAAAGAFLPAVLYAIDLLAERRTFARFFFAALLGPLLLSQGHPESVAHIAFIATLYALWIAFAAPRRGGTPPDQPVGTPAFLGTLGAAAIVAALLSAPIIFPFLEAMPRTMRYEDLKTESHRDATAFSDFPSLALLVHPRIYGEHPGRFWGPAVTEAVSGFAGILGIGAWFGLLARARFRDRAETFYLIVTALLFLWIADIPVISAPLRALFSMALNARLRLPFSFFLAVQTAALLHHCGGQAMPPVRTGRIAPPPLLAAVAGAAATLAYVMLHTQFPDPGERHFALIALVPSVVVLIVALLFWKRPFIIALAVYVELFAASAAWNPVSRGTDLYPRTPLVDALLKLQTKEPYRIAGIGPPLFPNTNAIFGLEDIRVHDPMASARMLRLLRTARGSNPKAYYEAWNDPDSALLDVLNVRWVLADPGVDLADRTRYRLVYDGRDGRIYENLHVWRRFRAATPVAALTRSKGANAVGARAAATPPHSGLAITRASGDSYELRIDAPRETLVASSIAFWPGWRVTYNGRALRPRLMDGAFLGFAVPAGSGVVRVRFVPLSFWGGVAVSLLTLAVLAIIRARC
jgi:hypothetical protein